MTYIVASKFGPKGSQTGYVVREIESDKVVATFTNKQFGYWKFAKVAAERELLRLQTEG